MTVTDSPVTSLDQPADMSAMSRRAYALFPVFALLALGATLVDLTVAQYCLNPSKNLPGELVKILSLSEVFAHALGVGMIALVLLALLKDRRRLARVLACAYGSGLAADGVKLLVCRRRPHAFGWADLPENVWQTFQGWVPLVTFSEQPLKDRLDHAIQSFPSGHTATAVGLALGLTWLYPRGGWAFAALALLAALQRIESGAHYVSDTCAGAAIACLIAGICLDSRLAGRWFNRFEKASK